MSMTSQRNEEVRNPAGGEQPKYLGAWAYVFWTIVFLIPGIGFALVLIISILDKNVNRKKFARSFLCWFLIIILLLIVLILYVMHLLANADIDPSIVAAVKAIIQVMPEMMATFNNGVVMMHP